LAVKHIVWDWNGTLLADNHAVLAGVNAVCAEFGREPIDIEHWRSIFSRPLVACYEGLLGRSLATADWSSLDQLYHRAYEELLHTCGLAPGVPDELHRWAATGRSQSLLSMWFHHRLVPLITEFQLAPLFARVDGLRDTVGGGSKAEHLAAHLAAQQLDPADVLVIGDVVDDAVAAAHVGAHCVLVSTGAMSAEKLSVEGVPVVDSVAAAIALTNHPIGGQKTVY
jgi:phosphoglycolate phosphatase-like HAD superfamily hydrolase